MKRIIVFLLLITACAICFADPVEGFWLSIDETTNKVTAGWQIYQEGGKLYGKILSIATEPRGTIAVRCKESYRGFPVAGKVNTMPIAGTPWIFGLTSTKEGVWAGGNVVNPEDGGMYGCKLTFRPADGKKFTADTLEMRGEIGLGIGRSQFWRKSDEATASGLCGK